jgi:hypothetical protein
MSIYRIPADEIGAPIEDSLNSRLSQWILLVGNRSIVAGSITVSLFFLIYFLHAVGIIGLRSPPTDVVPQQYY